MVVSSYVKLQSSFFVGGGGEPGHSLCRVSNIARGRNYQQRSSG